MEEVPFSNQGELPARATLELRDPGLPLAWNSQRSVLVVALMAALSAVSYFQRTIISIASPVIAGEFHFSLIQIGEAYSAFIFGYAVAMIPAGRIVDRFGPRNSLTAFAFGSSAFTILTALPLPHTYVAFAAFLAIRLLHGVVTAPLYPAAGKMNAASVPIRFQTQTQGWIIAGAGVGGALSPFLFIRMLSSFGWRSSYLLTGIGTAVIGVLWHGATARMKTRPEFSKPMKTDTPWRRLLCDRNLALLTASYGALGYFEYLFFYWTFYYLGQVRRMDSHETALYTSFLWCAFTVMCPLGGVVSDLARMRFTLFGRQIVPVTALSLSALILLVAIQLPKPEYGGAAIALSMGLSAFSEASFWTTLIAMSGSHAGAAGGILNTGSNLGGFVALLATPWLASQFGWSTGLYVGCAVVLSGAFMWLFLDIKREIATEPS